MIRSLEYSSRSHSVLVYLLFHNFVFHSYYFIDDGFLFFIHFSNLISAILCITYWISFLPTFPSLS